MFNQEMRISFLVDITNLYKELVIEELPTQQRKKIKSHIIQSQDWHLTVK